MSIQLNKNFIEVLDSLRQEALQKGITVNLYADGKSIRLMLSGAIKSFDEEFTEDNVFEAMTEIANLEK